MDEDKKLKEISEFLEKQKQDNYKKNVLEFYTSLIAKSYDKASTYSNLIIMAGYALFFTFWGNIRQEIDYSWARISVILVLISVFFFLIWEIAKMICTSLSFRKLYKAEQIAPDKFEAYTKELKEKEEKLDAKLASLWIFELVLTIVPGLGGAIILIIYYVKTLFVCGPG